MFGHPENKLTGLWLHGLPLLQPTDNVQWMMDGMKDKNKMWYLPPSENRSELRSKTYTGIAQAMAEQWSITR